MNPQDIIEAIKAHAWPIVAAVVIGGLVRMVKADTIPINVPPRWRPVLALGLGLVSGACDAIIRGTAWQEALGMGLLSSFVAMGGHDVLIEALRGGQEVSAPKAGGSALAVVVAVLSAALSGCGASLKDAGDAMNAANDIASAAQPCLVAERDRLIKECGVDLRCQEIVNARFDEIAKAYDLFHESWCALVPDAEGCK